MSMVRKCDICGIYESELDGNRCEHMHDYVLKERSLLTSTLNDCHICSRCLKKLRDNVKEERRKNNAEKIK